MKSIRVLLAGITLAVVVAPLAAPVGASSCPGIKPLGSWMEIDAPAFATGDGVLDAYAVDPRRPHVLFVTNGSAVMRSNDAGCSWKEVFSLEILPSLEVPIVGVNSRVDQIVIPEAPGSGDNIYLAIEEAKVDATVPGAPAGAVITRPHVVASRDGGDTWQAFDQGLPALSGPMLRLRSAPSAPHVLYLKLGAPNGGLYASQDSGESWQLRGDPPGADVLVDPLTPDELWFVGGGLFHSVDGGATTSSVSSVHSSASVADVHHLNGAPSQIVAHEGEGPVMSMSSDGGRSWSRFGSPIQIGLSMAHGKGYDDVLMSTHLGVWRYQPPSYWREITPGAIAGNRPEEYEPVFDLQVSRTTSPLAFGFRPSGTIVRYDSFDISLPPVPPTVPPDVGDVLFTPDVKKIRLEPGDTKTVPYKLDLPPQPNPLDVFFLMDTTVSMESTIRGLQFGVQQIAARLSEAKIDTQFGVGEYKDYPLAGYGDPIQGDYPYRLNRKIGPADASLVAAIEIMEASGGGNAHLPESQLTALYQAVTGEGEPGFVEPGQDAGFRDNAYKVIVHLTDAPYDNSPAHPSPSFDRVWKTLKNDGVLQVGLAVFGPNGINGARDWLQQTATATDTLVPAGGVDCGGFLFLEEGDPLVCDVKQHDNSGAAKIAPAIVALLKAIVEEAEVGVTVAKGTDVVSAITPESPLVNVKERNELTFEVTYECPVAPKPSRTAVELVASVGGVGVAGVQATVVCGPLDKVKDLLVLPVPPPEQPLPAAVVVPAPPPPPAPVTNAQPQPNPNVQGAMAQQEQEQAQVAM